MQLRSLPDFQLTLTRTHSLFNDLQLHIAAIKDTPLSLPSEDPYFALWISNHCIKALLNVLSIPIDAKLHPNIDPCNLDLNTFNSDDCKIEYTESDPKNPLEWKDQIQQLSHHSSSSHYLKHSDDDPSCQENHGYRSSKDYKRGPYKNYTVEEKMTAVKMLLDDRYSVIEVSRKLRIPCKNIKRWSQYGVERKKGGGRKRFSPDTERKVAKKLKELYKEGTEVEYEKVQDIARNLSDDRTFKASRGWVVKFVERQSLRHVYRFV